MESKINLQRLEKKSVGFIFQTGIVDIGIGLVFIVSSLAMLFDDIRYYIDILYIAPILFIALSIRYIASPRMGIVNFSKKRVKNNMMLITVITAFLVLMVTATFFGQGSGEKFFINPRWIISGIIFSIFVAVAYFMAFDRMYLYAFLITGTFNLSEEIRENDWAITNGGYAYLLASAVLLIVGIVYLVRFLKKYSIPAEEIDYEH